MVTAKQDAFEDIPYNLYVLQKIERGLEDAGAGRILTEDQFDQRMAKWLRFPLR
jgi:hypothetical protein